MIILDLITVKLLLIKSKNIHNDLVELKEILGLYNFPEALVETAKTLNSKDTNLIKQAYLEVIKFLELEENRLDSLKFTEFDSLLEKIESLDFKIRSTIYNRKSLPSNYEKVSSIVEQYISLYDFVYLGKKYLTRLSFIEDSSLLRHTEEAMLEALNEYNLFKSNSKIFVFSNFISLINELKTNDSLITLTIFLRLQEIFESIINKETIIDDIIEELEFKKD